MPGKGARERVEERRTGRNSPTENERSRNTGLVPVRRGVVLADWGKKAGKTYWLKDQKQLRCRSGGWKVGWGKRVQERKKNGGRKEKEMKP